MQCLSRKKDEELLKFLVLFFLTSTASVDTDAIISYELWGSHSLTVMSLLRKRYDMIALFLQTVPKAHHSLAQPIITLNSPQAIIVA